MGLGSVILAAAGGAKALEYLTTTPHDRLLKKTVKKVDREASGNATLYVDHIDTRRADGNPDGVVDEINGVPDIILQDFPTNLVVEVEDAEGLQSPARALEQLRDFQVAGYQNVLLVPDEEETVAVGERLAEEVSGEVTVATPANVRDLV